MEVSQISLESLPKSGYFVAYKPVPKEKRHYYADYERDVALSRRYQHTFCGKHHVSGAWCPNCQRPLLRFLALDVSDPRLQLSGTPFNPLSLFYCWTCEGTGGENLFYRFGRAEEIVLIQYGQKPYVDDFPYPNYPLAFPQARAMLLRITPEAQRYITLINADEMEEGEEPESYHDLTWPQHQVGGEPYLVQHNPEYRMDCPICGRRMPFLASIADNCLDPRGFTGNDFVQVIYHYCPVCYVVGAGNWCD